MRAAAMLFDEKATCLEESCGPCICSEAVWGDVGLAAKDRQMSDSLKKCNGCQFMYYLRMLVVASGDVWVDHTVPDPGEALSVEMGGLVFEGPVIGPDPRRLVMVMVAELLSHFPIFLDLISFFDS